MIVLSTTILHQTCQAACAPFTPNDSEQRSPPTCYRGCWHVVSRGLFLDSRHPQPIPWSCCSSSRKALYNLTAFIAHAASLHQTSVHCGRFLAAASRRSLDRVSVPMWPFTLSGRLPIIAMVGLYPAIQLMGRGLILQRGLGPFPNPTCVRPSHPVLSCVSTGYPRLEGRLPTCYSPVRRSRIAATARLACLRRAASVRSEPGSNSPSLNPGPKTGKRFQFQTLPTQQPPGCSPNICLYFSVRIIELTGSPHASLETLLQPTAFRQSLQLFFLTFSSLISL